MDGDEFGKSPLMPHDALEFNIRAQVVMPAPAPLALTAGMRRIDGDDGSGLQTQPIRAFRRHLCRNLVPQHEGLSVLLVARASLPVVVQIAATDPHAPHPQANLLALFYRRTRNGLHAHVSGPVQTHGAHQVPRGSHVGHHPTRVSRCICFQVKGIPPTSPPPHFQTYPCP
jgi:hypothetical protein